MKRGSNIQLGPGAPSLILIFVALSLSALAMLSLMTARNDLKLGERSAQVTQSVYDLFDRAEEMRAQIREGLLTLPAGAPIGDVQDVLPEDAALTGDTVSFTLTDGRAELYCELRLGSEGGGFDGGAPYGIAWIRHELTAHTEDDLWN